MSSDLLKLTDYISQGGTIAWLLVALGTMALAVVVERWLVFRSARIKINEFLARIRKALIINRSVRDAIKVCEMYRSPVASIMKAGLLKYGTPQQEIERTLEIAGLWELEQLEKRLVVLSSTAAIAPLLGFLGTLLGMGKAFATVASQGAGTDPALFATGLSQALIPVITGIVVALPGLAANAYFRSRVARYATDVTTSSNMLLETFAELERGGITSDLRPVGARA